MQRTTRADQGPRLLLVCLVALSLAVHLIGIKRDLPYTPEIDEPLFVQAAVRMAALNDPDPGWFGHPASTLIYALAGVYRAWNIVHGGPVLGRDPSLFVRFVNDGAPFYLLGRLVNVGFALATLPLIWIVGRRVFDGGVGLVGVWLMILTPLAVEHAQMVRSDTSATFFGLLALWLCLRCHDEPRIGAYVSCGLGIGIATATRYFMVILAMPLAFLAGASWWHGRGQDRGAPKRLGLLALGLAAIPVGFVLAVPRFLSNLPVVMSNLEHEAKKVHPGADGLSPSGNLLWYLSAAIPDTLTWPLALLAAAGVLVVLRERQPRAVSLVVLVAAFLGGVSLSYLHWQRWIIPLLPVLVLLAASPLVRVLRALAAMAGEHRGVRVVVLALGILVASIPAASRLVRSSLQHLEPSTRVRARTWVMGHLPRESRIAEEWYTAPLAGSGLQVWERRSLADAAALEDYARGGYDILIVSSGMYWRYLGAPARYPAEAAFYTRLFREGELLQQFLPSTTSIGPAISVYRMVPARSK